MLIDLASDDRRAYRKVHRGEAWKALSIELRVTMNRCEVCRLQPSALRVLQAAHLVAEVELWALRLRERYLFDRRGLTCLCGDCHASYDFVICGVRDPARMTKLQVARARGRSRRFVAEFRQLELRRLRWAATMFREADGEPAAPLAASA